MYPHLDTALALSRSEQASLASINKELLQRNASLRSRIRDLDELLISRDKALDSNARASANTISTLQQSVMLMDQRLLKYQQRLSTQDEALASLESRLQVSEREKIQAQTDRQYLTQQLEQTKRSHHDDVSALTSKHQLDIQHIQDDLNKEIHRVREQWIQDQRVMSQVQAEKQALQTRVSSLESDRNNDRKTLVETLSALESKRGECNDLQREVHQLQARAESLTITNNQQLNQINSLNTRVQNLNKQLMTATEEGKVWKQDAETYHREKLDLSNENSSLRDVVRQLREDLKNSQNQVYTLQTQREQTMIELEQCEGDKQRADMKVKELQESLSQANNAVFDLQNALNESHATVRSCNEREDELRGQLQAQREQYESNMQALADSKQAEVDAVKDRLRTTEQALYDLRYKLKHAQAELNVAIDHNESDAAHTRATLAPSYRSPTYFPTTAPSTSSNYPRDYGNSAISSPSRYSRPMTSPSAYTAAPRTPGKRTTTSVFTGNVGMKTPTQVTATVGHDAQPVRIAITPMKSRYDE